MAISPAGSDGRHLCTCVAGFTASEDGTCEPCGPDDDACNTAGYGPCVASDFRALTARSPGAAVHPGIAFELEVQKRDFYSQLITVDSASVLEVQVADEGMELLGTRASAMLRGETGFAVSVRPPFANVNATQGTFTVLREPRLVFRGTDSLSESGAEMRSAPLAVQLAQGRQVCPRGSVLALAGSGSDSDSDSDSGRAGGCSRCDAGSYSLDALQGPAGAEGPGCFDCPDGGECPGGAEVRFEKGTWTERGGAYWLVACPTGHALVGGSGARQLQQACVECAAGSACTASTCASSACPPCPPGTFKDSPGIHACRPCPPDTFAVDAGATSSNDCKRCPANSGTREQPAQASAAACQCNAGFYAVDQGADLLCVQCPRGAVCREGGLRTAGGLDATGEVEWVRDERGWWDLRRCPR
eukprot:857383-Rhodomonas_salina.1